MFCGAASLAVAQNSPTQSSPHPENSQPSPGSPEARWAELRDRVVDLYSQGKYDEAVLPAQQCLAIATSSFGPDDLRLAQSLNNLAELYRLQGKYSETDRLYQQALAIKKKVLAPDDPDLAFSMVTLGISYRDQGKYTEAEPLLQQALAIRRKAFGPDHPTVATSLNILAECYRLEGKYAEAEPLFQQALAIREKTLGAGNLDVAETMNSLAALYQAQGKYSEAEPLYQQALAIRQKKLGPDSFQVANSLNALGTLYHDEGKYTEAEPLFQQALQIDEKALGPDNPRVAKDVSNLGVLYISQGRYGQAEPLLQRALAIRKKEPGGLDNADVASGLNNLAGLYQQQGKYSAAEPLYQQSLAMEEKRLGPSHPDVARELNNLAELYRVEGKYGEAEPLYLRSLAIREKVLGPDHPDVANSLNNLALLYEEQGRYGEAEQLDQRALAIQKKALGPDHPEMAQTLNNLAELYREQGKYAEAEPLYLKALAIREKMLGPDHPDVGQTLNNLGLLYREQGRYSEAEAVSRKALAIRLSALGPDDPNTGVSANNLAMVYYEQGKYGEAETLERRALAIKQKALGLDHPDVANSLNNLAAICEKQGKYSEAEPLYQQSLAIQKKALGPGHLSVAVVYQNLAMMDDGWNRPEQAEANFDSAFQILRRVLETQFAYMSEKERLGFLATVNGIFPAYASFVYDHRARDAGSVGKMYNLLLWEKGMVASSVTAMRARIAATGDKEASSLLDSIGEKRTQIARITASPPGDPTRLQQAQEQIAQLEQQANDLERELVKRSPNVAQQRTSAPASWEAVLAKLKTGEAAVEYMRYDYYDGKQWTGKNHYAALVLTPEHKTGPTFIALGDATTLECGPINNYRQLLGMSATCLPCSEKPGNQAAGSSPAPAANRGMQLEAVPAGEGPGAATSVLETPRFYDAFWKPLEPALGNAQRIYLSTDGVLSQVSLAVVPDDAGKLLIEKYDLRPVNSTKDLLREVPPAADHTAVLIGAPKFDATMAEQQTALAAISKPQFSQGRPSPAVVEVASNATPSRSPGGGRRSFDLQNLTWPPLPSTRIEVQQLDKLLTKPWRVEMYTGAEALEEVMKRLQGPRLLHIATHGFFLVDENQQPVCSGGAGITAAPAHTPDTARLKEDPMLRSGLVFTGANRVASGEAGPAGMDDGILTAYEAMALNLEGTALVVLSACETGLGQAQAGEGVFGLRRALQVAGAQSVMMSMWEVPDVETQRLMKLFYAKWLGGEEKHQALREAQLELRAQIKQETGRDSPQEWGAFVLVGP